MDLPTGQAAPDPLHGQTPRELLRQMPGLDFLGLLVAGRYPRAPMLETANLRLVAAEKGRVTVAGIPGPQHVNPYGGVHGGWYGTLLDTALGCSVTSVLDTGFWYTTLDYTVNITRALPVGTEALCVAEIQHAGRSTAVSRAELRGAADGRLYATGSTTCLIMSL